MLNATHTGRFHNKQPETITWIQEKQVKTQRRDTDPTWNYMTSCTIIVFIIIILLIIELEPMFECFHDWQLGKNLGWKRLSGNLWSTDLGREIISVPFCSESKNEHFAVVHTHQSSTLWTAASESHQFSQHVTSESLSQKTSLYHQRCRCAAAYFPSRRRGNLQLKARWWFVVLQTELLSWLLRISIESPGRDKTSFCWEIKDALCNLVNTGTNTQTLRSLPLQE